MEKSSFILPALKEHKLLASRVCKEHYEVKVEIENHIEEEVSEIPVEKIDKFVFNKDQKTDDDKNKEGLSQIQKIGYGKIECEDCNEAFKVFTYLKEIH